RKEPCKGRWARSPRGSKRLLSWGPTTLPIIYNFIILPGHLVSRRRVGTPMVNVLERRLVLRMLAYWSDLKGERDFPTPAEIDKKDIGEDWRFCALVALDHDLPRSRLLTVGNDLAPAEAPLPDRLGEIPPGTLLAAA